MIFEGISHMRVLITGGSGFIGSFLAEQLTNIENIDIKAIDLRKSLELNIISQNIL